MMLKIHALALTIGALLPATLPAHAAPAADALYPVVQMTLPPLSFRTIELEHDLMHEVGRAIAGTPDTGKPVQVEIDASSPADAARLGQWIAEGVGPVRQIRTRTFVNPLYPSVTVAAYTPSVPAMTAYTTAAAAHELLVHGPATGPDRAGNFKAVCASAPPSTRPAPAVSC